MFIEEEKVFFKMEQCILPINLSEITGDANWMKLPNGPKLTKGAPSDGNRFSSSTKTFSDTDTEVD